MLISPIGREAKIVAKKNSHGRERRAVVIAFVTRDAASSFVVFLKI